MKKILIKNTKSIRAHHELSRSVPPWHKKNPPKSLRKAPLESVVKVKVKANVKAKKIENTVIDV